mgnify:CR=1 FL=1
MPTILIVEDEDTVREVVSEGLQSEGYEVLVANNGLDGLRQAREADPDLILLDLMLPEIKPPASVMPKCKG